MSYHTPCRPPSSRIQKMGIVTNRTAMFRVTIKYDDRDPLMAHVVAPAISEDAWASLVVRACAKCKLPPPSNLYKSIVLEDGNGNVSIFDNNHTIEIVPTPPC